MTRALLMLLLCGVASSASIEGSSSVVHSSTSFGGAAQSESTNNGVTSGECTYVDDQGRSIKLKYHHKASDAQPTVSTQQTFVSDPVRALEECRAKVKQGQSQLQDSFAQAIPFPAIPFVPPFVGAPQLPSLPSTPSIPSLPSTSIHAVRAGPSGTIVSGAVGTGGVGTGGVVTGEVAGEGGVVNGQCAYVDDKGRQVKVSYIKYPDGTVRAESGGTSDPDAAFAKCQEKARQQALALQQQMAELQAQQQRIQEQILQQQQSLAEQIQQQQQNLFGNIFGGNFPFNHIPAGGFF